MYYVSPITRWLRTTCLLAVSIHLLGCTTQRSLYVEHQVEAPFDMPIIREYQFPRRDFIITDYEAKGDGVTLNTASFVSAIEACHEAGGGRVVVPAGDWLTGPIHLKSNVCLHLEREATIHFVDTPEAYLPAVPTSWEGMECYNYSPLVYAYECENIAITGNGTFAPQMGHWRKWFSRPKEHLDALKQLYTMASTDVPVEKRQMAQGLNHLRPHLIQFNRCKHVLLDGFKINQSPFWTIHLYLCENGIVRNLDVNAHGHNNDGIDLEMSRNFLVEDCRFDQGDDAVVIKSGRNQDAWRLHTPSENIVIRRCQILAGHTLLGIGSEMSGGIRNIYMHDCQAPETVHRLFFIKTNHRRGGFIEDIYMKHIQVGGAICVAEIDTEVLYQWRNLVPTYETRITRIENIQLEDIRCDSAKWLYELKGDERKPIESVNLRDIHVGCVADTACRVTHVKGLNLHEVRFDAVDPHTLPQLDKYISNK